MTQEAINQAIVLYHLSEDRSLIETMDAIYHETPKLGQILESPVIPMAKKEHILDAIAEKTALPEKIKDFLKMMCRYGRIDELDGILQAYYQLWDKKHKILRTKLSFAKKPKDQEVEDAKAFLQKQYPDQEIKIQINENPELLGGVLMQVNHEEYDWSYEGCLRQLEGKLT